MINLKSLEQNKVLEFAPVPSWGQKKLYKGLPTPPLREPHPVNHMFAPDTDKITGGDKDLRYIRSIGSGGGGAVYAVCLPKNPISLMPSCPPKTPG
jgi:hypothetical protein